jgi:hypothetical protein
MPIGRNTQFSLGLNHGLPSRVLRQYAIRTYSACPLARHLTV